MHPYLARLQIKPAVASYFKPYCLTHESGDLVFSYGDGFEHYGFAFHRVPACKGLWIAGNPNFAQVRQVMVCSSAMEAISWLNNNYSAFGSLDNLLFIATGAKVGAKQIRWINERLPGRTFGLLFGRDLLGRITDLRMAAGIRKIPVAIYYGLEEKLLITFRLETYEFRQAEFSLPAFERVTKFRFKIPAYKPKGFDNFFDQLKANANLTF